MTNQRPHRSVPKSRTLANPESYSQPHLRICFGVDDMNGLALEYDPTGDRTAIWPERVLFHVLLLLRGKAVARDMMVGAVLGEPDGSPIRAQRRAADSVSVSSTACRSKVERLMTFSMSAVTVCCCRDSRSSLSKRTFSMAMTAWAAKFCTSAICLSVNSRTSCRKIRYCRSIHRP